MKSPLFTAWALLLLSFLCTCGPAQNSQAVKQSGDQMVEAKLPNILFILTDDQGIGDLSLHGNDSIRTPNMDRLLTESARFSRFYVSPVCAPTRASFLSGKYAPRTGAVYVTRRRETMDDGIMTIPEYLRHAGYRTGLFGKWHNGATSPYRPEDQGFDEFLGFTLGHFNDYFNGELENERNELVPFSGDLTQILTDTAAAFMLEDSEDPFFAMLTYQAPHTPVQVADKYWDAVKSRGLTDYNTGIYAMIESVDDRIGQLLDRLERGGKLDNTIVIFSTDNGPNGDRYRMGLRGTKGYVDEGGVRVPFGIRFPGEHPANGNVFEYPAAHIDLVPTLLDIVDLPVPENLDGRSLLPLLNLDWGAGTSPGDPADSMLRSFFFRDIFVFKQGFHFKPYPGSMRSGPYLYVLRGEEEHELYAFGRDTAQENNLYDNQLPRDVNDPEWEAADLMRSISNDMRKRYASFAATVARPDLVAPPIDLDAANGPVRLLAHEGEPLGETRFMDEYGWANDWFVYLGLQGAGWPIVTRKTRTYDVTVRYHLDADTPKDIIFLPSKGVKTGLTLPPVLSEKIPVADRTKRKEVYPRRWAEATLPGFEIEEGNTSLRIVPLKPHPGLWIKEVILRRQ